MLKRINISSIFKGVILSVVLTFICLIIITALCYFLTVTDKIMGISVFLVTGVSVFIGGLVVAKNAEGSGLLHGLVLGIFYLLLMLLSELIVEGRITFSARLLSSPICVLASGMLGGIFGINSKR